jgi:hypothetical protein
MNSIPGIRFKITLLRWGVAFVMLTSLLSGYTSTTSAHVNHKIQTEWVSKRKIDPGQNHQRSNLNKTSSRYSWVQPPIFSHLSHKTLTEVLYKANLKARLTISHSSFFYRSKLPQVSYEDYRSA